MNLKFTVSDDPDASVDEAIRVLLTADFEIGLYIRESIVPRATLYFTGMFTVSSFWKIVV